jgi:hypothetical protein
LHHQLSPGWRKFRSTAVNISKSRNVLDRREELLIGVIAGCIPLVSILAMVY